MKKRNCLLPLNVSLLAVFVLLFQSGNGLAASDSFAGYEKEVEKHFISGDYNALWSSVNRLLLENQDDPRSSLYYQDLRRFADIVGYKRVQGTFRKLLDRLNAAKDTPERNARRVRLLLEYEKFLKRYNPDQLPSVVNRMDPVERWQISGPYRKYGDADLNYSFAPEIIKDSPGLPGRRTVSCDRRDGYVDLSRNLYPLSGVAYAAASFKAEGAVLVHVVSEEEYVLFINGKKVLVNSGDDFRNYRIIRVGDAKGYTVNIKMRSDSGWRFRIFCTDEGNRSMKLKSSPGQNYFSDFTHKEEDPYPFGFLKSLKPGDADEGSLHGWRGMFFEELDCALALGEYRQAALADGDVLSRYSYASALIWFSGNDSGSWRYLEGWKIINSLYSEYPHFVPAEYFQLIRLIDEKNYAGVLRTGMGLISEHPRHFPSYLKFIRFLDDLDYEKEFRSVHREFVKNFPDSIEGRSTEAAFYRKRTPSHFASVAADILGEYRDASLLIELLDYHIMRNEYSRALKLLKKNAWYEDDVRLADILMGLKNFDEAKKVLIRDIADGAGPSVYFRMGLVEYMEGSDPLMYWQRAISLEPSLFSLQEYADYLNRGILTVPLKNTKENEIRPGNVFFQIKPYDQASRIISRSRIWALTGAASRVFCEDVIHLNNEKGVEKWGEYKIPYSGTLHPVCFRVCYDDGSFSDTYSLRKAKGSLYVNMVGLKKNSVIVMQYLVDNPVTPPQRASFYSVTEDMLQSFEEPVDSFNVSVMVPEDIPLSIQTSGNWPVSVTSNGSIKYYKFSGGNLAPVYYENYSGSNARMLQWYSFTTVENTTNLFTWYSGLLPRKYSFSTEEVARKLRGASIEETVKNVYNHLSRKIILQRNVLYHPESPDTVLYRKSGTVEDKVVAARALLEILGVKSYIALVRSKNRPSLEQPCGPGFFDSVLLYIPFTEKRGCWYDFSDQDYSCGVVSYTLINQEAYILLKDSFEKKTLITDSDSGVTENISVSVYPDGNGFCRIKSGFSGFFSVYRRFFNDRRYGEEGVNAFCGGIFPSFSLNNYSIKNLESFDGVFSLEAEGSVLGAATVGLGRIIIEPVKKKSIVYRYINYTERSHPLIITIPVHEIEKYEYLLPNGYRNAVVQKTFNFEASFGSASFIMNKKKGMQKLTVSKDIILYQNVISPEKYSEFLKFCMRIQQIESTSLILYADKPETK